MKDKLFKALPWLLIITGALLVAVALYLNFSTLYHQRRLVEAYEAYLDESWAQEAVDDGSDEGPSSLPPASGDEEEHSQEGGGTFSAGGPVEKYLVGKEITGIIEIPRLNVKAAILEGTDDRALKYTVGHYPGSADLGSPGNCVLLGHRNYIYGHYFRKIDKLKHGDLIVLKKGHDEFAYKVTDSFVVEPGETWVLEETVEAVVTLITCTPVPAYTHRLIVRGTLD